MAKVLRGNLKGTEVEIHQFCNDWATTKQGKVYSITTLEFTDDEIEMFKNGETGIMFERFELIGSRFKRKKAS